MGTLENVFRLMVEPLALGAEVAGAATITVTVGYSLLPYFQMLLSESPAPDVAEVRQRLGRGLVLGLEIFIGALILRTFGNPTLPMVTVLGAVILLRTVMALSLSYETAPVRVAVPEPASLPRESAPARALWGSNGRAG